MSSISLSSRIKAYEHNEVERKLLNMLPVIARVDGRCFHAFCRGLKRPFDDRLSHLMIATAKQTAEDWLAQVAYTQSDEISFLWLPGFGDMPYDGRVQKLTSLYAAHVTAVFNKLLPSYITEKQDRLPIFDCRVFNCPNVMEAVNAFVWREIDATRNSLQMAAQAYFSHKQLHKKRSADLQEMLFSKGINWNDYPSYFKRGTYIFRTQTESLLTPEELAKMPSHILESNPEKKKIRREYVIKEIPPIAKILNKV
jgi:tRNA(His) 5'-end guanylyltransferase